MSKLTSLIGAVSLISASATLAMPTTASAFPALQPQALASTPLAVEKTGYFYGGNQYCFYPNGWRGPGYYLCGFPLRRGFFFPRGFGGFGRGPGFGGHGGGFGHGGFGHGGGHMGGGHMGGGHMGGHGGGGHGGHH